jgi:4-amino-4-deoxy-L-arabinose transferase-like glycosyltransferase
MMWHVMPLEDNRTGGSAMDQEVMRERTVVSDKERTSAAKAPWHRLALATIFSLSAFLNLFHLTNVDYGIPYYAAAVKNMLSSWHNFFFVSFDAGFVSVDKPPLGLWLQAASAYLFGFHGPSLMLPQAIAGVLSVAVLYHLVRRAFGRVAGLLAALVLALTPISVATSRNNTMDMLLVLVVLLAAWAFIHAAQSGSLGWVVVGALLVGLGFNIKMLEAFLVLPAFYLFYLVTAPLSLGRRFVHLGVGTLVVVVVSLSWAVVVDLTPSKQRPYVGSTTNNSEMSLILGYNGLDRLWGVASGAEGEIIPAGSQGGPGLGTKQNGEPGPFRLLNSLYSAQIGWLLPLALVGLVASSWQGRLRLPLDKRHQALVLWGLWFLTGAAYFSIAGGQHRYYTVMLAPAVAALVGVGVMALWSDYHSPGQEGWFLPLALVGTAVLHARILAGYDEHWSLRLTLLIVGLSLMAAVILVVLRLLQPKPPATKKKFVGRASYAAAALATGVGMAALLIGPTVWASYTIFEGPRSPIPLAGPPSPQSNNTQEQGGFSGAANVPGGAPAGRVPSDTTAQASANNGSAAPHALMRYLLANQGEAKYLLAATSSKNTALTILGTDKPVISLGGYSGLDPIFTTQQLVDLVDKGEVRFFLIPEKQPMMQMMPTKGGVSPQPPDSQDAPPGATQGMVAQDAGADGPPAPSQNGSARWVRQNCKRVPQQLWQSSTLGQEQEEGGEPSMKTQALYDCSAGAS